MEENQRVELAANEAYERWRATARDTKGRVLKGNSKPFAPPELPEGMINLSDPDSRVMRTQGTPPRQAYNAQAAVNDRQIILAAEITVDAPDFGHLEPMLDTTLAQLERHGVERARRRWCSPTPATGTPRRCKRSPSAGSRCSSRPTGTCARANGPAGRTASTSRCARSSTTERGRKLYAQRKITIEPVYGQIKYNRHIDRFMRRGRAAAQSEWRLVTATHNLLKLHSHWIANTA